MAIDNEYSINVYTLFGLPPEPVLQPELAAKSVQEGFSELTIIGNKIYGENVKDQSIPYCMWSRMNMTTQNIVRKKFVESLQVYNQIVGARQSVAIANLVSPFITTSEVIRQFPIVISEVQLDILTTARDQANAMANQSAEIKELHDHFADVAKTMATAVDRFESGDAVSAFRIYSNVLSDNGGYVTWLAQEVCSNRLMRKYFKNWEDEGKNICDEFWRSNISGGLSSCYANVNCELNPDDSPHCAVFNLQKSFIIYTSAEQNRVATDNARTEKDNSEVADLPSIQNEIEPTNARGYIHRGNAWAEKGDFDRAIADYTKAIEIDPIFADVYFYRGNAWHDKGDTDRAIADYTKVIELDPKSANSYLNRGSSWLKKGDFDRAIADYSMVTENDPKNAAAYNNRGVAWDKKGELDRAISDYSRAIEIDPKYVPSYSNRCDTLREKCDFDMAIIDCSKAIDIDPKEAEAYSNRGNTWGEKGDFTQAIADYTRAIEIDPRNVDDPRDIAFGMVRGMLRMIGFDPCNRSGL